MHTHTCTCICTGVYIKHADTQRHKVPTDFPSCETNAWAELPLSLNREGHFSCKLTEDRGIIPGRSLTQNVNSFEKEELLFTMQLCTQRDLPSLLRGYVMQFDIRCFFCRSCFPSLDDGRTSSVREIQIWFACVWNRKIKFASQPYQDMLCVLGQQRTAFPQNIPAFHVPQHILQGLLSAVYDFSTVPQHR